MSINYNIEENHLCTKFNQLIPSRSLQITYTNFKLNIHFLQAATVVLTSSFSSDSSDDLVCFVHDGIWIANSVAGWTKIKAVTIVSKI